MKKNIYFFLILIFSYFFINSNIAYSQTSFKDKNMIIIVNGQGENIMKAIYNGYQSNIINLHRFKVLQTNQEIRSIILNSSNGLSSNSLSRVRKYYNNGYINFVEYNFNTRYEEPKKKDDKFKYFCTINAYSKFFDIEKGIYSNSSSTSVTREANNYQEAVSNAISGIINELTLTTREVFSFKTSIYKRDFWGGRVLLNLGSNDGIKKDLGFRVYENNNSFKEEIGYVKIVSVTANTSTGIIKEGFWKIKDGDILEELVRESGKVEIFLTHEYLAINGNRTPLLNEDQKNKFPELNTSHIALLNINYFPSQTETTLGFNIGGGYIFGNNFYDGFIFDGKLLYRWDIVPDFFSLNFGAGPFLYIISQGKENVISTDKKDLDALKIAKNFSDAGLGGVLELNAVLKFGFVRFYSMISYRLGTNLSDWSYYYHPNPNSEKSEKIKLNSKNSIAYPNISIGSLTVGNSIGIAF